MCEWLSCSDWCDVRLMCGDRAFNAHRAVLASVSCFLRINRVLLSCPADESPVLIILPEFDFDAMSSILYYIYNGEVVLPNHKLKMFLDTANAMDIFIDQRYIPHIKSYNQYGFKPGGASEILAIESYNIRQLSIGNEENEKLVRRQETVENLNLRDNNIQARRWSKGNVSSFEKITSISRNRQRQPYLRDVFIKTYSQDDKVKGQTSGVPAISNKEYVAATSVHFHDAYEKQSSESFSDISKRTADNSLSGFISNYHKQLRDNDYEEHNQSNVSISYTVSTQYGVNNVNIGLLSNNSNKDLNNDVWENYTPLKASLPLLSKDSSTIRRQRCILNFSHININSSLKSPPEVLKNYEFDSKEKYTQPESTHTIAKVTIMNEVLQSPWHPRQPNSYRPYRKSSISMISENNNENKECVASKDTNNNSNTQIKATTNVSNEIIPSEQQDLKCSVCQEVFHKRQDYSSHMKRHSSITGYKCGECQKTFSQLRNFKYHMSVHRGTKEFAATCTVCGKHFNDKGYLSNHMKIHRNRKEYKCAYCPKSFNQRVAFNMHVRIHTGVKPHVCEECGKAFSRKMLLKQHQRTHSGERPYACAHCDKRFADRSNMTLHLRLHTGVKPFSCTICPKTFTKKHHLKSHLNFHTGAKPYSCPRCKLAFTQSSNMRTHFKKCNAILG